MAAQGQPAAPAGQQPAAGQPPPAAPLPPGRPLASHPVAGFIPWILFWVIAGQSTWETATIAALIAAVAVLALSLDVPGYRGAGLRARLSHLKLLDVATVVFFAALTVASLVTSRRGVAELDRYSQAIASGALAIVALGSIVAGHPFTVDYARLEAPPQAWHTALFKRINLVLTSVWAAAFGLCAVLGLLAHQTDVKGLRDWLNWYIPIAAIFVAFRFTRWYPEHARPAR